MDLVKMEGFTIKVEEENEDKPISLPDVLQPQPPFDHRVFEVKVELKDGDINQEEEGIKQEEEGIKQEEEGIKQEEEGIKQEEERIKQEEEGIKQEEDDVKQEDENIQRQEECVKQEVKSIQQEQVNVKQKEANVQRDKVLLIPRIAPVTVVGPVVLVVSQVPRAHNNERLSGTTTGVVQMRTKTLENSGPTSKSHKSCETVEENLTPSPQSPESEAMEEEQEDLGAASTFPKPFTAAESPQMSEDSYDCTFCGEKFARKPRLSKHVLATHLDQLLVNCPECKAQFCNKRTLANHRKYHTGEKPFCCFRCGKAFKFISNYRSHMNDHMGTQLHTCGECGAGFSTRRKVHLHLDTHHSPFWPYKCELCLKPFLDEKRFRRHRKTHAAKSKNG